MNKNNTCNLNYRTLLKIRGVDKENFLQNILSNDIKTHTNLSYSLMLSPQGKVLYDFFIFQKNDYFLLDIHNDYCDEIITKLYTYKLHADIELSKEDAYEVIISDKLLNKEFFHDPRSVTLGFRGYLKKEEDTFKKNDNYYHEYEKERLKLALLEFGIDFFPNEFFAMHINMDKFFALSFTKGCYIGQEVTARMNYLSKKRKGLEIIQNSDFITKENIAYDKEGRKIGKIIKQYEEQTFILSKIDSA
ncbi:MAG: folate-binding protein YgfZ [Candidatus Midichloriaceae bacterium]|jgi:folate-binding protein YgfZ